MSNLVASPEQDAVSTPESKPSSPKPSSRDPRRHARLAYSGPVRLTWEKSGEVYYAQGKTVDVSESGLRVEIPVAIPVGTALMISAERIKVSGPANVKSVTPRRAKFLIGLELCGALRGKL